MSNINELSECEERATAWRDPITEMPDDLDPRRKVALVWNNTRNSGEPAMQEIPIIFSNIRDIPRWADEKAPWITWMPIAWRYVDETIEESRFRAFYPDPKRLSTAELNSAIRYWQPKTIMADRHVWLKQVIAENNRRNAQRSDHRRAG